ncbi:MAG: hypothetical protein AAF738_08225, partial [Bacteroidota bacterium]
MWLFILGMLPITYEELANRTKTEYQQKNHRNGQKTAYLLIGIGIGIASILAAIYEGFRAGEIMDSIGGIAIGMAVIVTAITQRDKKDKTE